MSTTLATSTSAMFYSDEEEEMEEVKELLEVGEMEEMEEPIGANMTDLDVRKETEAFLEENKLRRANIRFRMTGHSVSISTKMSIFQH